MFVALKTSVLLTNVHLMIRIPLVCVRLSRAGFLSFQFELTVKRQGVWFYISFSNSWLRLNLLRSIIVWRWVIRVISFWVMVSIFGIGIGAQIYITGSGSLRCHFVDHVWWRSVFANGFRCRVFAGFNLSDMWIWNALAGLSVCLIGGYCYSQTTAAAATNASASSSTFSGKFIIAAIVSLGCILHLVYHTLHVTRHSLVSRHASHRVVGVLSMYTGSLHEQQVAKL